MTKRWRTKEKKGTSERYKSNKKQVQLILDENKLEKYIASITGLTDQLIWKYIDAEDKYQSIIEKNEHDGKIIFDYEEFYEFCIRRFEISHECFDRIADAEIEYQRKLGLIQD